VAKRFARLNFETPTSERRLSTPDIIKHPKVVINELRLTPIIEDLNELRLTSSEKKAKDDFNLHVRTDAEGHC
jgi:hypothetical protein